MKKRLFTSILVLSAFVTFAGGVKGIIKGDDGAALAFATIYVKQTGSGAVTDMEGHYEIALPAGHYDILYHYLGFETASRSVDITDSFVVIDLTLKTQVVQLQTVTIKAGKEDPAYTIMR